MAYWLIHYYCQRLVEVLLFPMVSGIAGSLLETALFVSVFT